MPISTCTHPRQADSGEALLALGGSFQERTHLACTAQRSRPWNFLAWRKQSHSPTPHPAALATSLVRGNLVTEPPAN